MKRKKKRNRDLRKRNIKSKNVEKKLKKIRINNQIMTPVRKKESYSRGESKKGNNRIKKNQNINNVHNLC